MLEKYRLKLTILLFVFYILGVWQSSQKITQLNPSISFSKQFLFMSVIGCFFLVIWNIILKFYSDSKRYSKAIKGSPEQPGFASLSRASLVVFFSIIITAYLGILRVNPNDNTYGLITVALYYISGFLSLVIFYEVGKAGYVLAKAVNKIKKQNRFTFALAIIMLAFGVLAWRAIEKPSSELYGPTHILRYVPDPVVLLTLFVPLLLVWVYTLAGAYGIFLFQKNVKGIVYKKILIRLTVGTVLFVLISMSRHLGDYLAGNTSQVTITANYYRAFLLLILAIIALYNMLLGIRGLLKIESRPSKKVSSRFGLK